MSPAWAESLDINYAIKNYIIALDILSEIYDKIGKVEIAIEFCLKALENIEDLYLNNTTTWAYLSIKISSLLGKIYININNIEESIKLYEKCLDPFVILKSQFGVYKDQLNVHYVLLNLYTRAERFNDVIEIGESVLVILNNTFTDDISQWPEEYLSVFMYLGSMYSKNEDYANAYEYSKKYFNVNNFKKENLNNLDSFVLPFLTYYQSALNLKKDITSLEIFLKEHIEFFKYILGDKYIAEINKVKNMIEHQLQSNPNKVKQIKAKQALELLIKIFVIEGGL